MLRVHRAAAVTMVVALEVASGVEMVVEARAVDARAAAVTVVAATVAEAMVVGAMVAAAMVAAANSRLLGKRRRSTSS